MNKQNVKKIGINAGLQFATFLVLAIFLGVTLYIQSNRLAHFGFWLFKAFLLERFIFAVILIYSVCLIMGIWASKEIMIKGKNHQIVGAMYGFLILIIASFFLPIYLSLKCALFHRCFLQRFIIRSYFEQVPYYLLLGLLPMVLIGIWLGRRISLAKKR